MAGRILIFFLIVTLIELYFLQAVKTFVQDFSPGKKNAILYTAYGIALFNFVMKASDPPGSSDCPGKAPRVPPTTNRLP